MSRFLKKTITIPSNVSASFTDGVIAFTSKDGKSYLSLPVPGSVNRSIAGDALSFSIIQGMNFDKVIFGTTFRKILNAIKGIATGHSVKLFITGVGFKMEVIENKFLFMNLGFSHPVVFEIPSDVNVKVVDDGILVQGIDIERVTSFASYISDVKPVEPYKGKGIKKEGDVVIRKDVKAGKK